MRIEWYKACSASLAFSQSGYAEITLWKHKENHEMEPINHETVLLFTRSGLGQAPEELQGKLAQKFLSLINLEGMQPAKVLFYTDGVKLVCTGSPVLNELKQLNAAGVELVICSTCLSFYGLEEKVEVGMVGGMPDIIEALSKAQKVISL